MAKKKAFTLARPIQIDPDTMGEPITVQASLNRGMAYYARKRYDAAERDFLLAVAMDPETVDGYYGLGMVYKASMKEAEAIQAFEKVADMIHRGMVADRNRAEMLRRLSTAHMNEIKLGDWNLRSEVWQRIQ